MTQQQAMRLLSRFRRPDPPPPPPYQFADPSATAHSELAASLVPPPLPRHPSSRSSQLGVQPARRKGLSALPLSVLHRVCELMLVVPRGWDEDADAARARAALYALRSVDRRFFLGTSRAPSWRQPGYS